MYKPSKPYKQKIIDAVKKTWATPYIKVRFDTYPIFTTKFSYPEVDHTDGIGTKGYYHWRAGTLRAAVIDALAMNLNDLAIVRARPYKLSNHITVPVEDRRVLTLVELMAKECRKRGIAMVGGENSFHDNMEGLDISMTVSGFIKKPAQNKFRAGDVLVGLKSSGLHSNGLTAVRRAYGTALRPEFTAPTAIYVDTVLALVEKYDIHGMMHITGGAFTKLCDVLGKADAHVEHPRALVPQKIFFDLYKKGFSNKEMYSTFNCGVGFVLSAPPKDAVNIIKTPRGAAIVGYVTKGSGRVHIRSAFTGKMVTL